MAQGIYTCVDAKGRRLTSDRPIPECNDRQQRELSPSGRVVRNIGPSLSANELAAEEVKTRLAEQERSKQAEEIRRARMLLARYPSQAAHDKERANQLATIDAVLASANRRVTDLVSEREKLAGDGANSAKFKQQLDDLDREVEGLRRFIANQEGEKQRINARLDDERARLQPLWGHQAGAPARTRPDSLIFSQRPGASGG